MLKDRFTIKIATANFRVFIKDNNNVTLLALNDAARRKCFELNKGKNCTDRFSKHSTSIKTVEKWINDGNAIVIR